MDKKELNDAIAKEQDYIAQLSQKIMQLVEQTNQARAHVIRRQGRLEVFQEQLGSLKPKVSVKNSKLKSSPVVVEDKEMGGA